MPSPHETVEAFYAAAARGDFEVVLELLHPDVEWMTPPTLPWSRGHYHGRDEVVEYFASLAETCQDVRVEPDEFLSCGERVVSLGVYRGRARSTGRDFAARFAHILAVRDGRVTSMLGHEDTATIRTAFENDLQ